MRTKFWLESLKERNHSEDLGTDERIVLQWILEKQGWKVWTGFIQLRTGKAGCCEHSNKPLETITGGQFLQ
jgi:hypothetical protein